MYYRERYRLQSVGLQYCSLLHYFELLLICWTLNHRTSCKTRLKLYAVICELLLYNNLRSVVHTILSWYVCSNWCLYVIVCPDFSARHIYAVITCMCNILYYDYTISLFTCRPTSNAYDFIKMKIKNYMIMMGLLAPTSNMPHSSDNTIGTGVKIIWKSRHAVDTMWHAVDNSCLGEQVSRRAGHRTRTILTILLI